MLKNTYFDGYKRIKTIREQVEHLKGIWPNIGNTNQVYQKMIELKNIELPDCADGWFVIPNWRKNDLFGKTYNKAANIIVREIIRYAKVNKEYDFSNKLEGLTVHGYLKQYDRTKRFWSRIVKEQNNSKLLIIPAQLGDEYLDKSAGWLEENIDKNEFGLGIFEVGTILTTHPKCINYIIKEGSPITCPGDTYAPNVKKWYANCPIFWSDDGEELVLRSEYQGNHFGLCGLATGFKV